MDCGWEWREQSNLFTKSFDTTSLSLQQHTCWELFHWSLNKMYWVQQLLDYSIRYHGNSMIIQRFYNVYNMAV